MNRRQFIVRSAAAAATCLSWKAWAVLPNAQIAPPRLLVVMLRGAYDGLSLLVPHGSPFYYAARPTIAIAAPDETNPEAALDIGGGYGLHPAMASSLYALFHMRQATLIPFSGSQDRSRSHFQAQDMMELGQDTHDRNGLDYRSGFLNRLVTVLQKGGQPIGGMSFTGNLTPIFKGSMEIPNLSAQATLRRPPDERRTKMLQSLYLGHALSDYVTEGIQTRAEVSSALQNEMISASRGAAKANGFISTAKTIAALMRDKPAYSIGFIDVGGWDTHVNQGGATGQLATNLGNLGAGLTAFSDQIAADLWRKTVVVVMSEFGRTFRENGNRGTDHGHGNTMWVLGGGLSGGKVVGEQTDLVESSLFEDRDLPVLNDYRSVLASIVSAMYALNTRDLDTVFPGYERKKFGIV